MKWKVLLGVLLASLAAAIVATVLLAVIDNALHSPRTMVGIVLLAALVAAAIGWAIQRRVLAPVHQLIAALRGLAVGGPIANGANAVSGAKDRLPTSASKEMAELVYWFNAFVDRENQLVDQLTRTAAALTSNTEALTGGLRGATLDADVQRQQIDQLLITIRMPRSEAATDGDIGANHAAKADMAIRESDRAIASMLESTRTLAQDIQRASAVLAQLRQETTALDRLVEGVRASSDPTDLLALNTAIDAAQMGEQGRGFANVATEVRSLTMRAQGSKEEIHSIVTRLLSVTGSTLEVMEQAHRQVETSLTQTESAGRSLADVAQAVNAIKQLTNEIAVGTWEHGLVASEIKRNAGSIAELAEASAAGARLSFRHAQELAALARTVDALVAQYRR